MQVKSKAIALFAVQLALFCSLVPASAETDVGILARDNTAFAMDLYRKLSASGGNVFLSPYSISVALAMTYGGARGNTEQEMAKTLRFSLDQDRLHPAFAGIESGLEEVRQAGDVTLIGANSLWPQDDYKFLDEYLSLVKDNYRASITPVDFKHSSEDARVKINKWVEDRTQGRIEDLIQPGILDHLTRLVLVNAVYFKGNWRSPFSRKKTEDAPFHVSSEETVQVSMMTQTKEFGYGDFGSLQVLKLPYAGYQISMIVLLPKATEGLRQLEADLSPENLERWESRLAQTDVLVFLPKFTMTSEFRLDKTLKSMGMIDAFSDSTADFSGMDGKPDWLYLSAVIHKAWVDVNEEGTEAGASTAGSIAAKLAIVSPAVFRADHPFIFLIEENRTGSILFVGRVTNPAGT